VESIASDAFLTVEARQGEQLRQFWLDIVERRVETTDLRQIGPHRAQSMNAGQIMWLMQRRQRDEMRQSGDSFRGQQLRIAVFLARHAPPDGRRRSHRVSPGFF